MKSGTMIGSFSIEDQKIGKPSTSGYRKISFQILIFTLSYISYAALHFTRSGWSIIKADVESSNPPGLGWEDNNNVGILDFAF